MSKFLDENGLKYFWTKIKTLMSSAIDTATKKFDDYLPLAGGTMSGDIVYQSSQGRGSKANTINLDGMEVSKGSTGGSSTSTLTCEGLSIEKSGIGATNLSADSVTSPKVIKTDATSDDILLGDGTTASMKAVIPEYSEGTLSVKQLQGKALDGKSNKTLALGFEQASGYTNTQSIDAIGKHNVILVGAGEEGVTDNAQQDGIYILSPNDIHLATKNNAIKLYSGSSVQVGAEKSINMHSKGDMDIKVTRAVTIDGATGNLTLGDDFTRLSAVDGKAFVRLGDNGSKKVHIVGDKMFLGNNTTDPEQLWWMSANGKKVRINGTDGSGMIQTNATEGSEEVKFRAGTDNTMRLNAPVKDASGNVTTPGGLRVFANLFALAEMATDLPTTLSDTAKTTLNTKSVQSILGDMLDKALAFRGRANPIVLTDRDAYAVVKKDNYSISLSPTSGFISQNGGGSASLQGNMLSISYGDSVICSIEATDSGDGGMLIDPNNNLYFYLKGKNYWFNFDKAIELGLLSEVDF